MDIMKNKLVVDLDGTLIKTDILIEVLLAFIKQNPFKMIYIFSWIIKGKAYLKDKLSQYIDIDVSILPYNKEVLALIKERKKEGYSIVLATASHNKYAHKIAEHLSCFDEVIASDSSTNLSGRTKANKLVELYGSGQFDYVGNSKDDLSVWSVARKSIIVNPDKGVLAKSTQINNIESILDTRPNFIKTLLKALRIHQYAKNALIFVPLAASHQLFVISNITTVSLAFLVFCLCASTVYLINDLVDLEDDRHHKTKRNRPFASGALDVRTGLVLCPLILVITILITSLLLPFPFFMVLITYYILTLLYSFKLKRIVMIDVITLAILYTLRIIAGNAALGLSLSFWLLAFSVFIFLSLALVKRYAELKEVKLAGKKNARGRGYQREDLEMLSSLGAASGYISVLVLALYINEPSTASMYTNPKLIWIACPIILYWISRVWMLTHRGDMHEDPVVFALKDKVSLISITLIVIGFILAV